MEIVKKLLIVFILFLFAHEAAAQVEGLSENSNGSFYSLFGVGYPFDNNTARELGLGIIGVSLDKLEANTLQNPALWGKNVYTTASSGLRLSKFTAQDETSESINALLETSYFQITFPLYSQKLGLSASLYPVTKSNFRSFSLDSTSVSGETIDFITDVRGSGGINKFEIGLGWNINKNIAIGYAPSLAFITKTNTENIFFQSTDYNPSILNKKITGLTFAHRFGTLLNFSSLLNRNDRLSIGATVALPYQFNAEEEATVFRDVSNTEQEVTLSSNEGKIKLPVEINAGLTYYPSNLVNISLEGQLQQWSEFESELRQTDNSVTMSDRYKLGLGAEYHPYLFNSRRFLSKFRYSAGVSYDSGHLTIRNQTIDTIWLSAGIGIPTRSRSFIDVSLQYGLRGTTSNSLVQENIWALNFSVNLTELMFIRPKLN